MLMMLCRHYSLFLCDICAFLGVVFPWVLLVSGITLTPVLLHIFPHKMTFLLKSDFIAIIFKITLQPESQNTITEMREYVAIHVLI